MKDDRLIWTACPLCLGENKGGMTEREKVMICDVHDDIFGQRLLNNRIKDVSYGSQRTARIVLVQIQKGQLWSHLDLTSLTRARMRPVTAHHMLSCVLVGQHATR